MKVEDLETGRELSVTNSPDNTSQKQDTRFQPGQSGNPAGRPRGARNKLSENFINALAHDFEQHGAGVIEKVRKERPHDYLKVAASLLPKQIETETRRARPLAELSDAELLGLVAEGIDDNVQAVLALRGYAPLTIAERKQLQNWEQQGGGGGLECPGLGNEAGGSIGSGIEVPKSR